MSWITTLGHRLYEGDISIDFVGRRKLWYTISAVIVILAALGLGVRGLNMGIEFKGGVEFTAQIAATDSNVTRLADAVNSAGVDAAGDPTVTTSGSDSIRVQTKPLSQDDATKIDQALTQAGATDVSQNLIGPSWGQQVANKALTGLLVFLVVVVLFIWAYFREWKMSASAIVAVAHDLIITVGVYAWSGFEVTPATVTGLLTILGYSLYDTVVVFDKVRENTKNLAASNLRTYSESANLAVNQTLVRSINTSITALLPVGAILVVGIAVLGTGPLKDLALALFVGMAAGTYSSIFIATPLVAGLKQREPDVQAQARRVEARRAKEAAVPTAEPVAVGAGSDAAAGATRTGSTALTGSTVSAAPTRKVAPSGAAKRTQPQRAPRAKRGRSGR